MPLTQCLTQNIVSITRNSETDNESDSEALLWANNHSAEVDPESQVLPLVEEYAAEVDFEHQPLVWTGDHSLKRKWTERGDESADDAPELEGSDEDVVMEAAENVEMAVGDVSHSGQSAARLTTQVSFI